MLETSGSAAYQFDWHRLEIVHADGRRWKVSPRLEQVYAALDACRGQALTDERLRDAIWGKDSTIAVETVRMTIRSLRQRCGRSVVETQPLARARRGGPMRCGYIVR